MNEKESSTHNLRFPGRDLSFDRRPAQIAHTMSRIIGALGAAAFGAYSCVHVVEPGHRAVIVNKVPGFGGISQSSAGEGLLLAVPFVRTAVHAPYLLPPPCVPHYFH